jgi:hypothetical protein
VLHEQKSRRRAVNIDKAFAEPTVLFRQWLNASSIFSVNFPHSFLSRCRHMRAPPIEKNMLCVNNFLLLINTRRSVFSSPLSPVLERLSLRTGVKPVFGQKHRVICLVLAQVEKV